MIAVALIFGFGLLASLFSLRASQKENDASYRALTEAWAQIVDRNNRLIVLEGKYNVLLGGKVQAESERDDAVKKVHQHAQAWVREVDALKARLKKAHR